MKAGDVVLYAVRAREKGEQAYYYGCEVVGGVSNGLPFNTSGEPITGVRAIYRRNGVAAADGPGRRLLERDRNNPGEKLRLQTELSKIYGPGELVTGSSCQGECACSLVRKRL